MLPIFLSNQYLREEERSFQSALLGRLNDGRDYDCSLNKEHFDNASYRSEEMTAHKGYERVDSDPTISENPNVGLLEGSSYHAATTYEVGTPGYEDELEREELRDCLADIPVTFSRRHRREGIFESSMNSRRCSNAWETTHLLEGHNKSGNEDESDEEDESKDEEETQVQGIKKYAKLILPHVGLVLLTCAYTVIGASIFYSVERPNEMKTKREQLNLIYSEQFEFVDALVKLAANNNTGREEWETVARSHMHAMSDQLFVAFEKYFLTSQEVKKNTTTEIWSFSTSIFFAVTVVTTIGYGNPVPITNVGRLVCIAFSLFGIPLTLVTIADMGKFLSEHLIWMYGNYLKLKHYLCRRHGHRNRREHVCEHCQHHGLSHDMQIVEELRIPALLVLCILVLYTALGGVLMSKLETWTFFTSFYWSFITMTTVGFGDLMPRRDEYMYFILLYIVLGLAITTMCIDLVGVQYIRKIHYFGRKIQDARSALAVVGGKVVLVSELYANLMQKRAKQNSREAYIIENMFISKHIIPFIPTDIRWIKYIDQREESLSTSSSSVDLHSCRFCHSRFSITQHRENS